VPPPRISDLETLLLRASLEFQTFLRPWLGTIRKYFNTFIIVLDHCSTNPTHIFTHMSNLYTLKKQYFWYLCIYCPYHAIYKMSLIMSYLVMTYVPSPNFHSIDQFSTKDFYSSPTTAQIIQRTRTHHLYSISYFYGWWNQG